MILVESETCGLPQPGEVWQVNKYYYLILQGKKVVCIGISDHKRGFNPFLSDSAGYEVICSEGHLVSQHPKFIL